MPDAMVDLVMLNFDYMNFFRNVEILPQEEGKVNLQQMKDEEGYKNKMLLPNIIFYVK